MPQLKYYDPEKQEWSVISTDGNNIHFSYGEFNGRSLVQVIHELRETMSGGSITRNTFDFHVLNIDEDDQREVFLPVRINPEYNAFLLFLNLGLLPSNSYSLGETGDSVIFDGGLNAGDELYLIIFKTVRTAPPDSYDGIIISEGSIQESKLGPAVQKKLNDAIPSSEKGVSLATLVDGKVPSEQLPNFDHIEEALNTHTEDATIHTTASEKETLQHIRYNSEMKCIEFVFPN